MNHSLKTGTLSGTILTILASLAWADIERTVVLGAIGAAVSFLVSWILKKILDRRKTPDS